MSPPTYPQSSDPTVWIGPSSLTHTPAPGETYPKLVGAPVAGGKWTSKWGQVRAKFGGNWHTGDDFAQYEGFHITLPQVWVNGEMTETRVVSKHSMFYLGSETITVAGKTFNQFDLYGLGHYIILEHLQPGETPGIGQVRTLYAHLAAPSTNLSGSVLEVGGTIGLMGSTGTSTGNHTHVMLAIAPSFSGLARFTRASGDLRPFWYYLSEYPFALVPLTDLGNLLQLLYFENDPSTTYNLPGQAEYASNDVQDDGWSELVIRHRGVSKQ